MIDFIDLTTRQVAVEMPVPTASPPPAPPPKDYVSIQLGVTGQAMKRSQCFGHV